MIKPLSDAAVLEGRGVRLSLLSAAQAEQLRVWRSCPKNAVWFGDTRPISESEQQQWFARYAQKHDDLIFAIRALPEDWFVGVVSLYNVGERNAEYGRLLLGDPNARGRGLAYRASLCLCQWGFDRLGLHDIFLWVRSNNTTAINLYRRLGFEERAPENPRNELLYMVVDAKRLRFPVADA